MLDNTSNLKDKPHFILKAKHDLPIKQNNNLIFNIVFIKNWQNITKLVHTHTLHRNAWLSH